MRVWFSPRGSLECNKLEYSSLLLIDILEKNSDCVLAYGLQRKVENIKTDIILSFFGLVMKLGPIAEWGLSMNKKTIDVNSENFETNKKGIFAVGDICNYPGKLKLILSGFHEVALASVECFKRARPNEKYRFEFTTSSKIIHERLGKKWLSYLPLILQMVRKFQ